MYELWTRNVKLQNVMFSFFIEDLKATFLVQYFWDIWMDDICLKDKWGSIWHLRIKQCTVGFCKYLCNWDYKSCGNVLFYHLIWTQSFQVVALKGNKIWNCCTKYKLFSLTFFHIFSTLQLNSVIRILINNLEIF